jgi:hypothetical protein
MLFLLDVREREVFWKGYNLPKNDWKNNFPAVAFHATAGPELNDSYMNHLVPPLPLCGTLRERGRIYKFSSLN